MPDTNYAFGRNDAIVGKVRGKITIRDVARAAGVSITTVSRYLNGQYGFMSEATKARIAQVIHDMGYRPNRVAQALKGNRTGIVGAVVVNLGYPLCVSVIRALSDELEQFGMHLMVAETHADTERERRLLEAMHTQSVDALVIQTDGANNDVLAQWLAERPVVWFDRGFGVPGGIDVITDNLEASRALTAHLAEQGYTRIVYVSEPLDGIATRVKRLQGYQEACASAGITPWVIWIDRSDEASFESVVQAVNQAAATSPVAVYTANGLILQQLYPRLRSLALPVPATLGIATFDQPDWADIAAPALTCVRQPAEQMGREMARRLQAWLAQAEPENAHGGIVVLRSELRIAESTLRAKTKLDTPPGPP